VTELKKSNPENGTKTHYRVKGNVGYLEHFYYKNKDS
jgi:hypothetical protein